MAGTQTHSTVSSAARKLSSTVELAGSVLRCKYATGQRAEALQGRMGLARVRDLLMGVPRRYIDLSELTWIGFMEVGHTYTCYVEVLALQLKFPRVGLSLLEVRVADTTGVLIVTLFNQPWLKDRLVPGTKLIVKGEVQFKYGFKRMTSPLVEIVDGSGAPVPVLPVYGLSTGMSQAWMRRIVSVALADRGEVIDPLPAYVVERNHLYTRSRALRALHYPKHLMDAERARQRFAFEELFYLNIAFAARSELAHDGAPAHEHVVGGERYQAFVAGLPFELTAEQQSALAEIAQDMAAPQVMNRLLQGDVGTGKTVVAAAACAIAVDTGCQTAMMAPTTVLATQYARSMGPLLEAAGIRYGLITGATPADERSRITQGLAVGAISVAFGTTALLSDDVQFCALSLIVIDEQHRFGVNQRAALRAKGSGVDALSMTATPIPRSLALSIYGDTELSTIKQRPGAGGKTTTKVLTPENMDLAWGAINEVVAAGQQVYVVVPLVEPADTDTDRGAAHTDLRDTDDPLFDALFETYDDVPEALRSTHELRSVEETADEVASRVPDARVGMLHGKMSPSDKNEVMSAFANHDLDVLVSTTVIEVGVDVPNATVMLIMDADRFGLATLHQLRGRVGRGQIPGRVFLKTVAKRATPARKRLSYMEKSNSGFELAQLDLELRHEGDVLGLKQTGAPTLRVADLVRDEALMVAARTEARQFLSAHPHLQGPWGAITAFEVIERFGAYFHELEKTYFIEEN